MYTAHTSLAAKRRRRVVVSPRGRRRAQPAVNVDGLRTLRVRSADVVRPRFRQRTLAGGRSRARAPTRVTVSGPAARSLRSADSSGSCRGRPLLGRRRRVIASSRGRGRMLRRRRTIASREHCRNRTDRRRRVVRERAPELPSSIYARARTRRRASASAVATAPSRARLINTVVVSTRASRGCETGGWEERGGLVVDPLKFMRIIISNTHTHERARECI